MATKPKTDPSESWRISDAAPAAADLSGLFAPPSPAADPFAALAPREPHTLHRADAPETSVQAAHGVAKGRTLSDGQRVVLAIFAESPGGEPMTDDEMIADYERKREARGWPRLSGANTLRPRRSDLTGAGFIAAQDEDGTSDAGKPCTRWVLTEKGRAAAARLRDGARGVTFTGKGGG